MIQVTIGTATLTNRSVFDERIGSALLGGLDMALDMLVEVIVLPISPAYMHYFYVAIVREHDEIM